MMSRPAVPNTEPAAWPKRRRRRRMDNRDIIIELVPGPTPYFWIGERGSGEYLTSIDADKLADWLDALRGAWLGMSAEEGAR